VTSIISLENRAEHFFDTIASNSIKT